MTYIDVPVDRSLPGTSAQYAPMIPGKGFDRLHLLGGAELRFVTAILNHKVDNILETTAIHEVEVGPYRAKADHVGN